MLPYLVVLATVSVGKTRTVFPSPEEVETDTRGGQVLTRDHRTSGRTGLRTAVF